jgi:hypothetical protein
MFLPIAKNKQASQREVLNINFYYMAELVRDEKGEF